MRGHIFVTDANIFPVVRDNGFYGVGVKGIPPTPPGLFRENLRFPKKPYASMIGDTLATRPGDIVFLYERGRGFHGVYRVVGKPFFDPTPIGCVDTTWLIRVEIECANYFPKPVPEEYMFSSCDYESRFWVWFYWEVQGARGVNALDPDATEALIELLVKVNGRAMEKPGTIRPYPSPNKAGILLPPGEEGKVPLGDVLRAWIVANIDDDSREDLREIFGHAGEIESFANNVPYQVTRKSIDILCYHRNSTYTTVRIRYKFSVAELKRDSAGQKDVHQVGGYCKWVAGRLAGSEIQIVQPILIAYRFTRGAITKVRNCDFGGGRISLFRYRFRKGDIVFERVKY